MLNHHLIERLIISIRNQFLGFRFIETARLLHKFQKRAATVVQMREPMFDFRRAERMNIEANVFAVASVFIPFENANLIERTTKIRAAEWFVLIVFQSVLIVQMQRPKFSERHAKI